MFKRKKNQAPNARVKQDSLWQWLKHTFTFSSSSKVLPPEKNSPLPDVTIEELEIEMLDAPIETGNLPDIEIAFINPETGELEVINLPQETFKIKVENQEVEKQSPQDPLVVVELDLPLVKDKEDEDPYSKITHFPPSSRLH